MILLVSSLIRLIQQNHILWQDREHEEATEDLFGLRGFERDWKDKAEDPNIVLYQNTSAVSIINNLLGILSMKPQYFRPFTLQNCQMVIDNFYQIDQLNQLYPTKPFTELERIHTLYTGKEKSESILKTLPSFVQVLQKCYK